MPTLGFWFKECELGFRQEACGQEKRLCHLKYRHESVPRSPLKVQRESYPSHPYPQTRLMMSKRRLLWSRLQVQSQGELSVPHRVLCVSKHRRYLDWNPHPLVGETEISM